LALLATTRPTLAWLLTSRSALALRSLVLLLSTRCRAAWAFSPRASWVSAAALDSARLLLGLRPRLLCGRLLPHLLLRRLLPSLRRLLSRLGTAWLHIGGLLARSYAVCAWPLLGLVVAAFSAALLRLGPAIAAFRALPLLLTTIWFLRSLPRLTATFGARALLRLSSVTVWGTLLSILAPPATSGPLAFIGVAIAILSALTLVGVAVAVLGALPLVAVAVLRTLPIVGVTALVRALLSPRGARRIVAETTLLARTKRARRGYVPLRPDLGAGLPNRRLRTEALSTQVLLAHHDRTANPGSAG
jgi:hypothetical protein